MTGIVREFRTADVEFDLESISRVSDVGTALKKFEGSSCFWSASMCSNIMSKELEIHGLCADLRISVTQFAAVWVETVSPGCESVINWSCRSRNESSTGFTFDTGNTYDVGCEPRLGRPTVVTLAIFIGLMAWLGGQSGLMAKEGT